MKKIFGIVFALFLVLNLAIPARAVSTEYEIPEFGLTISIPEGYAVFTRDMKDTDPLLQDYGFTMEDVMDILGTDIYLDAIGIECDEEIVVSMYEDMGLDLSGLGDTALRLLASGFEEGYEEAGAKVFSMEVYHHPKLNFLRCYLYMPEENTYVLQYYTIYDGNGLSVTLRSYSGAISDDQEKKIQSVIDSVAIPSYTPEKPQAEEAPAFLYTDQETGVTFTIPAGWVERSPSKEWEYMDAVFSFTEDPGLQIVYGSKDLSAELSALDRLLLEQGTLGEEVCAALAEEMGVPESAVSMKTYHEEDYFLVEASYTSEEYGMKVTATVTQAIHIEGGWVYLFQVVGKQSDLAYGELEKVLESVEYGKTPKAEKNGKSGTSGNSFSDRMIVAAFEGFFASVLVSLYAIIKKSRRDKKAKKEAMGTSEYVYCHSCGKRFPAGTRFCDVCGEKLREGDPENKL